MRRFLKAIVYLVGGLIGATVAMAGLIRAARYLLRLISRLLGNDDGMILMWLLLPVGPIALSVGFFVGGMLAYKCFWTDSTKNSQSGFEVIVKVPPLDDPP